MTDFRETFSLTQQEPIEEARLSDLIEYLVDLESLYGNPRIAVAYTVTEFGDPVIVRIEDYAHLTSLFAVDNLNLLEDKRDDGADLYEDSFDPLSEQFLIVDTI